MIFPFYIWAKILAQNASCNCNSDNISSVKGNLARISSKSFSLLLDVSCVISMLETYIAGSVSNV